MTDLPMAWTIGAALAGVTVLAVASRRQLLDRGGLIAAAVVGLLITAGLGSSGLALLVFFFVTSSALTKLLRGGESRDTDGDARGRTASQVFANAGVTAIAAAVHWSSVRETGLVADGANGWVVAAAGGLAAATADTWASEIGEWRRAGTRLVTTWRRVAPGTNGGVSWPGSTAALAAALSVGALSAWLFGRSDLWMPVAVGGVVGMLADSLAGATIEGRARWIDNDAINWLGTLTGAAAAVLLTR